MEVLLKCSTVMAAMSRMHGCHECGADLVVLEPEN